MTTVYAIQINNYTQLFSKMSVKEFNNLNFENLSKYKLSGGHETLLGSNYDIQDGDIIVIRPENQFVGAMQHYKDLQTPQNTTNTDYIYSKLIGLGIPYYVRIKGDGACFYYSFVYGLFMTALLNNVDPSPYLNTLKDGMEAFVRDNTDNLRNYKYDDAYTEQMHDELTEFGKLVQIIHNNANISSTIKRLMLDSIFNSFPLVMDSLRFAVKCVWLNHYKNTIDSNNKPPQYFNTYEEEIATILPKYEYASNAITEVLPSLFYNAPIVVYERVLNDHNQAHIDTYYNGFNHNNNIAFMAYTGGHYDAALKAGFKYDEDAAIKTYIELVAKQPEKQPVNDTGFTKDEMEKQIEAYKIFENERNNMIDEAIATKTNDWTDVQLKDLATEPGINRIFANNNNFTDKQRLSQLRDFIVKKGSVELLKLLYVHTKDFNQLSKPDENSSINVKKTYLYALDPVLYEKNKAGNDDDINAAIEQAKASTATSSTASTTALSTALSTTSSTASTTASTTYYSAWVKIQDDGTVTEVVFDNPLAQATTLAKKSNDTYVEVQFTLSDKGFASTLQFPNDLSDPPTLVSTALDQIYNNKSI